MIAMFYALVALIALAGQAQGANQWLGWPLLAAILAVAALEFGGVVLSRHALQRMKLGETALFARVASASVAAFAVGFNWLSHSDHRQGAFFAGMSALGYVVWLLDSGARRRDGLRAKRMLPEPPPAYGWARWLRHPVITREARALAIETPALGLHGSINEALAARKLTARRASIAKLLHRKIRESVDGTSADIATAVYDMDEVAERLAAGADYDGLTALIARDLTPARISGVVDVVDVTPVDVVDEPVKTPSVPKPRPRPVLSARPVSPGPVRTWDVDGVVQAILDGSSTPAIMSDHNVQSKTVQRVRAILRAVAEGKTDAEIINNSLTAPTVVDVRAAYEKAMANK